MSKYDYSIQYSIFHDGTNENNVESIKYNRNILESYLDIPRESKILDVGCGFGYSLFALKELGFTNIQGFEVSTEQAQQCVKNGFNVATEQDSIQWLNSRENEFDVILLLDVLEHVPVDLQIDFLRAIYKALKKSGKLVISVPNSSSILSSRWKYNDYTHYSSFTEHSLYFVLKNAGFNIINIECGKGLGKLYFRFWKKSGWKKFRRRFIRWCWLQVFEAEIPFENIENISFELNLMSEAIK